MMMCRYTGTRLLFPLAPFTQGKDGGDADDEDEEGEDEVSRRAAVPLGMDQRRKPGSFLAGTQVIDHDHGGDGQTTKNIQGRQALRDILINRGSPRAKLSYRPL